MNEEKLIIFDFDGTIVNSKQVYYHSVSKHLRMYGFSKKEIDDAISVGLSVAETLKKLGFSWIENWVLKRRIMKGVLSAVDKIKKCKDVDAISNINVRKILVSNSISNFVFPIIRHFKLMKVFDEIYCADDFDNKEEFIKEYLKERKIDKRKVYYVGDRVADIVVARKVGIKSIIVVGKCAWDSKKEILNANPDFVVDGLKEIREIIR